MYADMSVAREQVKSFNNKNKQLLKRANDYIFEA